MKSAFLVIFIFTITIHSTKSQTNFKQGYVITNNMDTLFGFIDYRGEVRNSKMCIFKPNMKVEPTNYLPDEIHSYRFIDSKYYITKSVDNEKIFLEFLVNGLVNLYYLKTKGYPNYFLEKDGRIYKLTNEQKEVFIEGNGTYITNSNKYIGIMKATFGDCMEIQPQLNNAKLNQKSLTDLTVNYHNMLCNDRVCVVYQKAESKYKVSIAPVAGIEYSQLKYDYYPVDFEREIQPQIGLIIKNSMPKINEKLSFNLEATLSKPDFIGYYEDVDSYAKYQYDYSLKSYLFKLNGTINYEYPKGKFRPTVAFGAGLIYLENQTFDITKYTETSTDVFKENYSYTAYFPTYYGLNTSIGCNYYLNKKQILFGSISYKSFRICKIFSVNLGIYLF